MSGYYSDGRGRKPQQRSGNSSGNGRRRSYYEEDRYERGDRYAAQRRNSYSSSGSGRGGSNRRKKKKRSLLPLLLVLLLAVGIFAGVKFAQAQKAEKAREEQEALEQEKTEQEDLILNAQTYYEGVSVNGVSLGGLTREEATAAVEQSLGQQEHTLTLQYGDQSFSVSLLSGSNLSDVLDQAYQVGRDGTREENLARIESLKTEGVEFTVEAGYSLPDMTDILEECAQAIDCAAQDATVTGFSVSDSSFTFEEGKTGLQVDKDATLAAAQSAVASGNYDANLTITVQEVQPEMDKATLKSKFKRLATFTTTTTSNSNRNTNIRLCAAALSGTVVQKGEEFSVNALTGKRTAEKGYKDAAVIKNGVYVQEPGGGVCQVSSTLFNAVVRAGLKITERHNHTIVSSYVPVGEDAAVDYPSKDFKFLNNSDGPIAVVLTFDESNKKLKASVYGIPILEDGVTLDLASEVTQTIPIPEPTYTEDPTLEYGQEVTVTKGLEGQKVTTYLITKKDGKEVSREVLYKSSYPKRTPVIAINSQATESSVPEETTSGEEQTESTGEDTGAESSGGDAGLDIPEE